MEMRLLRDTRRVLEYLPNGGYGQSCVYDVDETTKCGRSLQLLDYINAVEQVIWIIKLSDDKHGKDL